MTDTERLAALLAQCQPTYVDANGDVREDDDYYGEFAARLRAAGVTVAPSDPAAPLREAALWLATATDNLAHWDHEHGYVINSERDSMAGNVESAWDALRAALRGEP